METLQSNLMCKDFMNIGRKINLYNNSWKQEYSNTLFKKDLNLVRMKHAINFLINLWIRKIFN
jgi:hypothetical protein